MLINQHFFLFNLEIFVQIPPHFTEAGPTPSKMSGQANIVLSADIKLLGLLKLPAAKLSVRMLLCIRCRTESLCFCSFTRPTSSEGVCNYPACVCRVAHLQSEDKSSEIGRLLTENCFKCASFSVNKFERLDWFLWQQV